MDPIPDQIQVFVNEVADSAEANLSSEQFGKINWAELLTFIQQLWSIFGPIVIPLIVPPTTDNHKP